ncbi:MAG: CDP-alcohol phosphatidyltransferase family protein [Acidobacteria bacterium]|nr:CDP-alcohol phosphatidyltransferase family protein [Acidobacteriota bacterium]
MPSVYALKPGFQNLLSPCVKRLASWGVTPNQVTLLACGLSVTLGFYLAFGNRVWILLPIFLPLRMALNAIDGMLARNYDQETRIGAVLNELCDLISDAALTLPFAYVVDPLVVGAAIFFAVLTEVAAILGGGPRRNHGPFGKSDRAVVLGFCGAWLWLGWPAHEAVALAWIALCVVTVWNRGKAFAE